MSLFRCPKCHLPITDTEIQAGACTCGFSLAVNSAALSTQSKRKQPKEYSPVGFNLVLVGGIVVFLAALSYGIWWMSESFDSAQQPPTQASKSK